MQLLYIVSALAASATPALAVPVAARATTGCGKFHLPGLTTYHGLTSSGRDRKYSVHLPANYDKSKPFPTVLGFHGSSSIGLFFEVDTKFSESRFSANVHGHSLKCSSLSRELTARYRRSWSIRMA